MHVHRCLKLRCSLKVLDNLNFAWYCEAVTSGACVCSLVIYRTCKSPLFHFTIQYYLHVVLQTLEQLPEESDWKTKANFLGTKLHWLLLAFLCQNKDLKNLDNTVFASFCKRSVTIYPYTMWSCKLLLWCSSGWFIVLD